MPTYRSHWLPNWAAQYTLRIRTHIKRKYHIQAYSRQHIRDA